MTPLPPLHRRIRKVLQQRPVETGPEAIRQHKIHLLNEALVSPMWIAYSGQ